MGQFRTKLKITRRDVNQGSLQIVVLGPHLAYGRVRCRRRCLLQPFHREGGFVTSLPKIRTFHTKILDQPSLKREQETLSQWVRFSGGFSQFQPTALLHGTRPTSAKHLGCKPSFKPHLMTLCHLVSACRGIVISWSGTFW